MKINIYTDELDAKGGIQNTLIHLLNNIDKTYDVMLYTFNKTKIIYKYQKNMTQWKGKGNIVWKLLNFILYKLFKPRKAQVHISWNTYCKYSCEKARKQKGSSVVWIHNDLIKSKRKEYVRKCNYKAFDNIVAVSDESKKSMIKLGFKNCKRIYNLVDDKFISTTNKQKVYDFINVSRHVNSHKDIQRFIDIAKSRPNKNFIQIGGGKDYEENITYSRKLKNIKFKGAVDSKRFIEMSKNYLLTSKFEGFPIVILEALAAGCNVYATPVVQDFSNDYWKKYIGIIDKDNNLIKPNNNAVFNYQKYKSNTLKDIERLFEELNKN